MSEWIEVEGDKPKVERTRHYFAAMVAGMKTAQEYARYAEERLRLLEAVAEAAVAGLAHLETLAAVERDPDYEHELAQAINGLRAALAALAAHDQEPAQADTSEETP